MKGSFEKSEILQISILSFVKNLSDLVQFTNGKWKWQVKEFVIDLKSMKARLIGIFSQMSHI